MRQRGRKTPLKTLANPLPVVRLPRTDPAPPPPDYLSTAMQAWWKQVMAQYVLEPHHIDLLEAACGAWDRMMEARKVLAERGLSYEDSRGRHHPLPEIAIEQSRLQASPTAAPAPRAATPPLRRREG